MTEQPNQTPPPGPGADLNRLVALKLGWREDESGLGMYFEPGHSIASRTVNEIPHYSTEIGAAWKVLEYLKPKGYNFSLGWMPIENIWDIGIYFPDEMVERLHYGGVENEGDTAPETICRAFLALPDLGEVKE